MSDVKLDSSVFFARAKKLFNAWDQSASGDTAALHETAALQVLVGDASDDAPAFTKSASIQTWLLGFEFPSTLMVFWRATRKITFVCSSSKAKILRQLHSQGGVDIDVRVRAPKDESTASVIPDLILELGDLKVGNLPKDKAMGKLADEWNTAVAGSKAGIQFVDVSVAISSILADKDAEEINATITAARLTSTCMSHYFKTKMEALIDRGTKITHEAFAQLIEEKIGNDEKAADMKLWNKNPQLKAVDFTNTDWVFSPIIQSGGDYDLRVSAYSNESNLAPGVILSSLGIRYKSYCASMGRTFMISPSKKQEANFQILLEVRQEVIKMLKDGAIVKDVYNRAASLLQGKGLGDAFVKNIGFATGLEYRDSSFLLAPKNDRALKENMMLVVTLGLSNLQDKKGSYSLILSDTVKVGIDGGAILTEGCTRLRDVVMELDDDEEDVPEVKPKVAPKKTAKPVSNGQSNGGTHKSPAKTRGGATRGAAAGKATRGAQQQIVSTTEQRIKAHQAELHAQRKADGLKKWANGGVGKDDDRNKVIKRYESYRREEQLPNIVQERRIWVDEQRQTIVLPINGFATPFHIATVKNVTKVEESSHIALRINFQSPGQIAGKKEDMPFEDPDATFIRSLTFRSKDQRHMMKVFEQISALKKAATKREAERKEMADVIEQEKLIEIKGRHPYVLKHVFPRPATEGKKSDGNLEIHQNGIRFRPDGPGAKIDLLFSNIKHLFFQPSEKELIVLLHVHLRAPIMIGKKKTLDVQFYREVSDMNFDETTGKRRKARYGDEDEIEQEQEDRRRRQELDKMFQSFAKRISDAAQGQQYELEVDVPFRELGFNGVPNRTNVVLMPTTDCLVHLSEWPPTVITLSEVEIVHFERVQFGLKAFDMVFVLNEFKKNPIAINSIPVVHLDNVKEWLDSVDIPISEGPVNLSWPQIMKTINEDPYEFYKEGGWEFLTGNGESGSEDESSEGSVFDDSDGFGDESSDDDDDDSSSDDFGDESDDSGSDGDDFSESGDDWDELERKAKKSDDKRREAGDDVSDDDRRGGSKTKAPAKRRR